MEDDTKKSQDIRRGVARYFFFRSILMKRHFDTDAAEVWAKYTSEEQLSCKHSTEAPIWSLLAPKSLDFENQMTQSLLFFQSDRQTHTKKDR